MQFRKFTAVHVGLGLGHYSYLFSNVQIFLLYFELYLCLRYNQFGHRNTHGKVLALAMRKLVV